MLLFKKILKARLGFPKGMPQSARRCIRRLLQPDRSKRLGQKLFLPLCRLGGAGQVFDLTCPSVDKIHNVCQNARMQLAVLVHRCL